MAYTHFASKISVRNSKTESESNSAESQRWRAAHQDHRTNTAATDASSSSDLSDVVGAAGHPGDARYEIKRRPGGYGGWVGQKYRPSIPTVPEKSPTGGRTLAERFGRTVTADGGSYDVSEDGCLISGYIASSGPLIGD